MGGVKPEHLDVSIVDESIHIMGETTRGSESFVIDRRIRMPRNVDADSAECTHENGVLTLTLKRKAGKRIRVNAEAVVTSEPVAADAAEFSEGEWVEKDASTKKDE